MKAVGVDGCPGGWVAMVWDSNAQTVTPEIHATLASLIAVHPDAGAIAIDIPIGLSPDGRRTCDYEARKLLGPGRGSSVFPPPVYAVLDAETHSEAVLLSKSLIGKGVSQQAFAIFDKIKEANDTITPTMQDRVFEMHPEVSFRVLAGRELLHHKSTPEGYEDRRALLEWVMGIELPDRKEAFSWARPAKPDDILDATVVAWSAMGVLASDARANTRNRLSEATEFSDSGLRMEMVFGWDLPSEPVPVQTRPVVSRTVSNKDDSPVTRQCLCGCGNETKSRFNPGHDGRLYSQLARAEKDGDQEAETLRQFLEGNHDRSTFDEQRARVSEWLGHQK